MKSILFSSLSVLTIASSLNATGEPQAATTQTAPATSQTAALPTTSALTQDQVQEVQKLIESTIQSNPTMVLNALQAAMEQAKQQELDKMKAAVASNADKIFKDPNTPTNGDKNAPVKLAIFLDPNCGACKMFHKELNAYIKTNKDLEIVFKDISIFGEPSAVIVRGLLAANLQGKYEQLQNAVLESKDKLDEKSLLKLAGSIGIDSKKLQADMNSDAIKQQLESNMQLAQALGVNATPTWIVGEQVFQGYVPQEELKQIVASAKSNGASATTSTSTEQKQAQK